MEICHTCTFTLQRNINGARSTYEQIDNEKLVKLHVKKIRDAQKKKLAEGKST